jgi:HD superfamily phosphohydrolase
MLKYIYRRIKVEKQFKNQFEAVKKLHQIYSEEIPVFIKELCNTNEMQRLKQIGQNCGQDYLNPKLYDFLFNYSRYDHSLGVALIIWNFTKDMRQAIAGLFHDIATPTFAHVVDFLKKDYIYQEATEENVEEILNNSVEIKAILEKYNIRIGEVIDYKIYEIADNNSPKLSADRLEYNLYLGITRGIVSWQDIKEVYDNITFMELSDNELIIKDVYKAEKLAKLALENGIYMSSDESKMANYFLADILSLGIKEKLFSESDLYILSEEQVINKIKHCNLRKIVNAWQFYTKFDKVNTSDKEIKDKYCISINVKKRYINPMTFANGNFIRLFDINTQNKKLLEEYLSSKHNSKYIYLDYTMEK